MARLSLDAMGYTLKKDLTPSCPWLSASADREMEWPGSNAPASAAAEALPTYQTGDRPSRVGLTIAAILVSTAAPRWSLWILIAFYVG